jgi:hypothetical protein
MASAMEHDVGSGGAIGKATVFQRYVQKNYFAIEKILILTK